MILSRFIFLFLGLLAGLTTTLSESRAGPSNDTIGLQVRLARANASPGPIDGKSGKNMSLAISAFQRMHGMSETGRADSALKEELAKDREPILASYTIGKKDAEGPFEEAIPEKMEEMAELKYLNYTSIVEALAEKFHMSQELLRSLNPDAKFVEGDRIQIANVGKPALPQVKRIEVDKARESVWVYGEEDRLIAAYPATIGSDDTP